MKANELMIGGYFRVNRDGLCIKKGTIVRIVGIDGEDKLEGKGLVCAVHCHPLDREQYDGGIWLAYLDPIPLTPEILEKNGFGYVESDSELSHYYPGEPFYCADIDFHIGTDRRGHFWLNYDNNSIYGLRFVHELQHAFRLCGIEKEIIL